MSNSPNQPTRLSAEVLTELRRRVQENVYAHPDFADALARRILESGHL